MSYFSILLRFILPRTCVNETISVSRKLTRSQSLTHALYHLAANPEYIKPLREEVEQVIKEQGWTKAAMNKLRKLDSFMKESQRLNGVSCSEYRLSRG